MRRGNNSPRPSAAASSSARVPRTRKINFAAASRRQQHTAARAKAISRIATAQTTPRRNYIPPHTDASEKFAQAKRSRFNPKYPTNPEQDEADVLNTNDLWFSRSQAQNLNLSDAEVHFDLENVPNPEFTESDIDFDPARDIAVSRPPHPIDDLKPFYVNRPVRRFGDKLETSATGERLSSKHWDKFIDDPQYNMTKEKFGFDTWYGVDSVLNPQKGLVRDFYTKNYMRDAASNEATMPARYQNVVKLDELQLILQKADHYFYEDRPAPTAQLLVPLRDPRTTLPSSPLSQVVTKLEQKHGVELPYSIAPEKRAQVEKAIQELTLPKMRNEKDVLNYLEQQVDTALQDHVSGYEETLKHQNSIDQRQPNISLALGENFTAQQRRAEFWRKYLEIFSYVDVLHTTMVRCTRSIGRVGSYAALVIMGNGHGIFTYGRGKAPVREQAIRIALLKTRRNVLFTPLHENRAPYYRISGLFKASSIVLIPQARGVGLRAGRLTFTLLRCVGYRDASAKLRGRPNIWNIIRAWMECLIYQESYREIANARGMHYQRYISPFTKNPPVPSREEVQEMEDVAAQAFKEAVIDVFKSRQLFETDTFKDIVPHFTERANFNEKWDRFLDMANVPQSVRLYPGFSEYLDAKKLMGEKKFREEWFSDLDDAWSPTETDDAAERAIVGAGVGDERDQGSNLYQGKRENPTRYRTARDDQPYYQYYRGTEEPQFNRKAQRFAPLNNHISKMAKLTFPKAVGINTYDQEIKY